MNTLRDGTPAMNVYQTVRKAIICRQFVPGQALTENYLCERFSVGRSPVRAALQQLSEEGFIELVPNRGANVAQFTQKQLRQLYSLRGMVLSYALERTIDAYEDRDYEYLDSCLERQKAAFEHFAFEEYITAVSEFYRYIIEKAGNDYLDEISSMIISRIGVYLCLYDDFYSVKKLKSLPLHHKMVDGIRKGNIKRVLKAHSDISLRIVDSYDDMVLRNGNQQR